ncbi:hypothetical protein MBAV_006535 [Candidatus Magnetobacterium bavaricum]|uniref:Chordopoxvirus fusion protein n=1 Tax=Candidatus Magnetobacterium bavaricum TaxID=29290 RepID=A0A0F3GH65_9BACT|nr:hypothetical protein MBAV_006535 [Candidatus Magnetobacterium bavaricum]
MQRKQTIQAGNDEYAKKSDLVEIRSDLANINSVLSEILTWMKKADKRLDETNAKLDETNAKLDETNAKLAQTNIKLEQFKDETNTKLTQFGKDLKSIRVEIGGLSKSVSYALENEAYRFLPTFLKDKYDIEVTDKFVRTQLGTEEINILGKAIKNGIPLLIVGEAKLRIEGYCDKNGKKDGIFKQLRNKIKATRAEYPHTEILTLIVTHFATPEFVQHASEKNIITIQSFQW